MADFPAGIYASRAVLEGVADSIPTRHTLTFAQAKAYKMRGLYSPGGGVAPVHEFWISYGSADPAPPSGHALTLITHVELFS